MIKSYFKTLVRIIRKQKVYSFINILGLAVGLACCALILLWIRHELSYDRFHQNADRLYRVIQRDLDSGTGTPLAYTQDALASILMKDYPEIQAGARVYMERRLTRIKSGEKTFYEDSISFADPPFFEMFSFTFLRGNSKTALSMPTSVVLTRSVAQKYFGDENPMGKRLSVDFGSEFKDLQVTGVIEDVPLNSHLQFKIMVSFKYFWFADKTEMNYYANNYYTYVLLNEQASYSDVDLKIRNLYQKHVTRAKNTLSLQPLKKIHLTAGIRYNPPNTGDIKHVYILSLIALIVLAVACINFMNLATAQSGTRAKEIGVRKVVGASRRTLIFQLFGESFFFSFLAFLLAFILLEFSLPVLRQISGLDLKLFSSQNIVILIIFTGIMLVTGLIAGSYPALFLSSLPPTSIFKGTLKSGPGGKNFRKILVVFQFSISIGLIVATLIVSHQVSFMRNKKLGFNKDNLIFLPLRGELRDNYEVFKEAVMQHPDIISVSASNILPIHGNKTIVEEWEGRQADKKIMIHMNGIYYDYIETFQMKMKEGRSFSKEYPADATEGVIVNEEAVRQMEMNSPLSKRFARMKIIGVVRDYHFMSLHEKIEPTFLYLNRKDRLYFTFLRVNSENFPRSLQFIKNTQKKLAPGMPFEYSFFKEHLNTLYKNEQRIGSLFNYFAGLALFISCLGLYGLASFLTEQRVKEIGIRKVLGASSLSIALMLSKEFSKWVLCATVLAWPLAYYVMQRWLHGFAYRTSISPLVFVAASFIALFIAQLTVGYKSLRAAFINPAHAIRYE